MKITIETIPHKSQRYDTCGDWTFDANGDLTIKVSELSDWRREVLIGIHELIEVVLCKHDGVTQQAVDDFDMKFNPEEPGDEPGDESNAPYKKQHCIATGIERILAAQLGVDWKEYETELNKLP